MNLPHYQTILLDRGDLNGIHAQIGKFPNEQRPLVINILHFKDNQLEILENLENYFEQRKLNKLPYSVWVISDCIEYRGSLQIKSSPKELPNYFHFKSRPLNSKENLLFSKVNLKQKNIASIRTEEYNEVITEYARYQKEILAMYEELLYYKKTTQRIDIFYGKKRS